MKTLQAELSASLWGNRAPQKHRDHGTKRSTMPTTFSVEAFLVHRASVNLIKPSNIVLWWQEQSQSSLLQESQIGPLPSQRWWCCQHKALFLDCLEQPYFCQKHPFKKFTGRPNDKNILRSVLCFLGVNACCCPLWNITCLHEVRPSVAEPKTGPWGNHIQYSPHITFQW